jgi:hypothetical protein
VENIDRQQLLAILLRAGWVNRKTKFSKKNKRKIFNKKIK